MCACVYVCACVRVCVCAYSLSGLPKALAYLGRIQAALPAGSTFQPLMTLYLTDKTDPAEITRAKESGKVFAVKLYPAGATTNSDSGVTDIAKVQPVLAKMAEVGMPLCVHSEVTDQCIDIFEREPVFLSRHLQPIIAANPDLKIILEHITTKEAVKFVMAQGPNVAATITAHHLIFNRNAIFQGGLRPHFYCLPVLKHESDRLALTEAIKSGSPKFFMGTDSAPHTTDAKESDCCSAGVFTAHAALELYAKAFDEAGCIEHLAAFASKNGHTFYGLPAPTGTVKLTKEEWTVPMSYPLGDGVVRPCMAGEKLAWKAELL